MTAFILGNGISRKNIDINVLSTIGPVYGCNALYREFTPTVLVATDTPIANKIQESGYAKNNKFYTRRPIQDSGAIRIPSKYYGFSSGPVATALAALDGNYRIYLIGFDLGASLQGRFNNVYADTEFYKRSDSDPTFTGNWTKQLCTIATDFPKYRFIRVHGVTTAPIDEFSKIKNMEKMDLETFVARINTSKDL